MLAQPLPRLRHDGSAARNERFLRNPSSTLSQSIVRVPRRAPEPRSAGATLTSAVLGLDLGPKLGLELGLDHGTARALTGSSLDAPWSPMLQSSGAPCGTGKTRDTCAQPPNQGRTALHLSASAAAPARVPCPRPVPAAIVTASRVQAKAESLNGPQSARMRFPPRIGSSRRPRYQNLTYAFGRATARA